MEITQSFENLVFNEMPDQKILFPEVEIYLLGIGVLRKVALLTLLLFKFEKRFRKGFQKLNSFCYGFF